ncbi:MAG: efflux RND transporter permease subunit [Eubacterium sp.]|jgi:multidrug efflux pump subunit AcrB
MEKFSVKKPFTVLVAVIFAITLGVMSLGSMTLDLLPDISIPYMAVIVPYPGASPEKIESEVSEPLENSLGTINGLKNIYSLNYENYAIIELEFEDDTDMDSALVRTSSALNKAESSLPDDIMTPTLLELNVNMVATMYTAVSYKDYDIEELSQYTTEHVVPGLERCDGVASVSTSGLIEKSIQVDLNQEKIDKLNDKILSYANSELAAAEAKLNDAEAQVEAGQAELESQQAAFGDTFADAIVSQFDEQVQNTAAEIKIQTEQLETSLNNLLTDMELLADAYENANADKEAAQVRQLMDQIKAVIDSIPGSTPVDDATYAQITESVTQLIRLSAKVQAVIETLGEIDQNSDVSDLPSIDESLGNVRDSLDSLNAALDKVPEMMNQLESALSQMSQAQLDAAVGFSSAATQLYAAQEQLAAARTEYETTRQKVLASANADSLLSADSLSQLIYAQNFSMPAGYIDDEDDNSWLLKVGDEYDSSESIEDSLLADIEGIGQIRISDVADVTVIDNSDQVYARLNGEEGVILSIFKSSAAGTNEVSEECRDYFSQLEAEDPDFHYVTLVDQGQYIKLIIGDLLESMLLGGALAIVVLAIFLRNVRPTLVVAISIPLSVLFAIIFMRFAGLSINIMTLSGLSLGVGMLVDNSIVVLENIFRLRTLGIDSARASVQGAKQVRAPIISSTLTTVCVFIPMIFTHGYVKELLVPMALSITFCLLASLLVALTVVPASSSTIMRRMKETDRSRSHKILEKYGHALRWCLEHKAIPLTIAIALLAVSVFGAFNSGIVLIPDMDSTQIEVTITTPEDLSRTESFERADEVVTDILKIDGIDNVGVMDQSSSLSVMSSLGSIASEYYGTYIGYVDMPENTPPDEVKSVCKQIEAIADDTGCEISANSGSMSDLEQLVDQHDITINVYGSETDGLEDAKDKLIELLNDTEGFTNASAGNDEGSRGLHLVIDRDKAVSLGLTVAQVYVQISERLQTSVASTTVTLDGVEMQVTVTDETDPLTKKNLMDMEFTPENTTDLSSITGEEDTSTTVTKHKLSEFATVEETVSPTSIQRKNQSRYITVTADAEEGYNSTLLVRDFQNTLDTYNDSLPNGYSAEIVGTTTEVNNMLSQMTKSILVAILFIYLVMVAQFQSLLSPFIILFTVPLAFTGGMAALMLWGEPISAVSLMGLLVLVGTVVNNGIVFVDFANKLRLGGMERREALILTGKTRMRPILMTVLAMAKIVFGSDLGSQLAKGMALVLSGGLIYATFMTLFIIPIMYDLFFKRKPLDIDVGGDLDETYDDAAEYLKNIGSESAENVETGSGESVEGVENIENGADAEGSAGSG